MVDPLPLPFYEGSLVDGIVVAEVLSNAAQVAPGGNSYWVTIWDRQDDQEKTLWLSQHMSRQISFDESVEELLPTELVVFRFNERTKHHEVLGLLWSL